MLWRRHVTQFKRLADTLRKLSQSICHRGTVVVVQFKMIRKQDFRPQQQFFPVSCKITASNCRLEMLEVRTANHPWRSITTLSKTRSVPRPLESRTALHRRSGSRSTRRDHLHTNRNLSKEKHRSLRLPAKTSSPACLR